MKIIILIEQTTTNLYEYTVRTRINASSVHHVGVAGGFTTIEDAKEYAETLQRGMEIAGAEVKLVVSEEIADELPDVSVYPRDFRIFNFEHVWSNYEANDN
jgi:hypothetical protein